jgi:hypothetical protein
MKILKQRFAELLPHILDYNYTVAEDTKLKVTNSVLQHYLQGKQLSTKAQKEITQVSFLQTKLMLNYHSYNDNCCEQLGLKLYTVLNSRTNTKYQIR